MNTEQLKGNWNVFKGRVKEKYGEITDDDLAAVEGRYDQLVGLFQKRLGKSKEEAEKEVDTMMNS